MLTTEQLTEQTKAIVYPTERNRDAQWAARQEYNRQVSALEAEWAVWLHATYAPELTEAAAKIVFQTAWDNAHSSGYNSIEFEYEELVEFVRKVNSAA